MENKRLNIIKEMVNDALLNARKVVNTNPTEKQAKAGNYRMGHVRIKGFEITIENPKGSYRKGKDTNGKEWKTLMHNDYGYFTKTVGKDGDAIDVFIGPNLNSEKVYPIDQYWKGEFDETKVMLGFNSKEEAKVAYLSNYEKDWKGFKYITEVDIETFKKWLYDGYRQRKPFAKYEKLTESFNSQKLSQLTKNNDGIGINENKKRINDKGEKIPLKCYCGGNINLEIHGEPIFKCEKCDKYYGSLPFPTHLRENFLNESLSSIVYHFTDLSGMWQIAKTDAFKLQHSLSTPSDSMSKRGNMNFISFTRDFSGKIGYSRGRNVRIKLDGDKLNQRYAGKAVSYWGASMGKNDYFANPETTISGKAKPIDRFQGRTENEDRLFTNEPIIDDFYDYIINVDVLLPSQESFMERALNMIRAIYSTGIGYYKMRVFDNEKDFNNPYSKNFLTYDSFYKKYGYNHELSVSNSSYEAGNKNRIGRYLSQLLSYIFRNEPLYSREERIKAGGKLLHQYGLEHFNKVVLNRIESLSSWDYDNIFGAIKSLRNECDNETWRKINRLIYDFTRKNNIKNAKDMRKWYKGAYGQVMEEKHRFITEKEVRERFRKELKNTIHRKISDAIKEKESK